MPKDPGETNPVERLARNIASAQGSRPKDTIPPVRRETPGPAGGSGARMRLPPGLREAIAQMIYEFWQKHHAETKGGNYVPWEKVPPKYQLLWLHVTQLALELALTVVLSDVRRFLENSNGDMGAAFAKALGRYIRDILDTDLP